MASTRKEPTQEELKKLVTLDKKLGVLIWKETKSGRRRETAGGPSGNGYYSVMINGVRFGVHRLIWIYLHGGIPEGWEIDHRDGNPANNRPNNLRVVTVLQQNWNRRASRRNKFGIPGVHWDDKIQRFRAKCTISGKTKYLGVFKTLDEAKKVRESYSRRMHGEFERGATR